MEQKIISFDEENCQVVLLVDGLPPYAVDLPIDENGNTLEGAELDRYLQGFYPYQHFERKNNLKNGVKNADAVRSRVTVVPEIILSASEIENQVKVERIFLLSQTDWTQLPDVSMPEEERNAWRSYRQTLRDITSQPGFPTDIIWPINPGQEPR